MKKHKSWLWKNEGGGLKSSLFLKALKVILKYTFMIKIWSMGTFKGQEQIAKPEIRLPTDTYLFL